MSPVAISGTPDGLGNTLGSNKQIAVGVAGLALLVFLLKKYG